MYLPPAFREDRLAVQHDLMRAYPLALVITAGVGGLLANPIPVLIYPDEGTCGTLRAHLSRGNPQWQELGAVAECLVVFQGPQEYITPSWYATKQETQKVVPTWNYATVQAWGRPRLVEDSAWLRRQLDDLTHLAEHTRLAPWHVGDAPDGFIAAQMKGIIGVEIPIARLEGKWKVSQNRPAADRQGVIEGLRAQGASSRPMADLVAERSAPTR